MKTSLLVFLCLTCLGQVKGYAIGAGGGNAMHMRATAGHSSKHTLDSRQHWRRGFTGGIGGHIIDLLKSSPEMENLALLASRDSSGKLPTFSSANNGGALAPKLTQTNTWAHAQVQMQVHKHEPGWTQSLAQGGTQVPGQVQSQMQAHTQGWTQRQAQGQVQNQMQTHTQEWTQRQAQGQVQNQMQAHTQGWTQRQAQGQVQERTQTQTQGQGQAQAEGQEMTSRVEEVKLSASLVNLAPLLLALGSARLSQAGSTDVKLLLQTPSVAQEVLRVQDVTSGGEALARSAALNVLTSAEAGAGAGAGAAVGAGAGAGAGGAVLLSGLGGVSTGFGGGGVSFENDGDFDDDLFDDRFDDDRFEFDDDWFDFDDIFDDDDSFEFGDFGFGTSAGQVSGGVDVGAGGAGAGFDWITLLGDAVSGGGDLTALEAALCDAGFNLDTGLDLSSLGVGSSSEEVGLTSSGGSLGTLGFDTGASIDAGSLLSLLGAGGDALFPQGSVSVGVSGPTAGRVSSSFLSRLLPAATAPSTVSLDLQSLLPSAPRTVSLRGTDLGISSTFPGVQQTVSTTASRPLPSVSGAFLERLGLGGTTTVDVSIVLRRLGLQSIRVPSYYYRIIVRIVTRIIYGQATSSDIRYLLKIISYFRSSATTGTSGQTTTSGQATTSGQLTSGQVISGPAVSGQAPSSSTRITLRTLLQQPTLLKSILTRLALRSGVTTGTTGTSGTTVGGTVTGTSGGTTTTTGTTSSGRSFRLLLEALKAILRRLKIVEAARSTQTSTGAGLTGGATVDLGTSVGVSTGGSVSQGQTTSGVSTGSKSSSEDDDSNRDVIRQLSSLLLSSGASGILGKGVDNGFDNGFNGNGFDGNGINGNGFDNGFNGNGFDNGFNGNGFDNGFNGNGFDNGFNGNGFDNGFNGVDNGGFKILTSSGTAGVTSGTSLGSSLASLLGSTSGTGTSSVNLADLIRKLSISAPSLTSGSTTTTTGTRLSLTDLYALIRKLGLSISSSGSLGGSSSITSGSTGTIGGSLSGTSSGSLGVSLEKRDGRDVLCVAQAGSTSSQCFPLPSTISSLASQLAGTSGGRVSRGAGLNISDASSGELRGIIGLRPSETTGTIGGLLTSVVGSFGNRIGLDRDEGERVASTNDRDDSQKQAVVKAASTNSLASEVPGGTRIQRDPMLLSAVTASRDSDKDSLDVSTGTLAARGENLITKILTSGMNARAVGTSNDEEDSRKNAVGSSLIAGSSLPSQGAKTSFGRLEADEDKLEDKTRSFTGLQRTTLTGGSLGEDGMAVGGSFRAPGLSGSAGLLAASIGSNAGAQLPSVATGSGVARSQSIGTGSNFASFPSSVPGGSVGGFGFGPSNVNMENLFGFFSDLSGMSTGGMGSLGLSGMSTGGMGSLGLSGMSAGGMGSLGFLGGHGGQSNFMAGWSGMEDDYDDDDSSDSDDDY